MHKHLHPSDAPWCKYCQSFEPEYAKVAETLEDMESDILLAKVDVTEHKQLAEEYNITSLPALRLHSDGKISEYPGPITLY